MVKNNITLQIRVPADVAMLILGRLYGCGCLTREQYMNKVKKISIEKYTAETNNKNNLDSFIDKCLTKRRTHENSKNI